MSHYVPQWETSDGRRLYPYEMTDNHLKNCLRILKRMQTGAQDTLQRLSGNFPILESDDAQYFAEMGYDLALAQASAKYNYIVKWIRLFEEELQSRQVEIPNNNSKASTNSQDIINIITQLQQLVDFKIGASVAYRNQLAELTTKLKLLIGIK